MLDTERRPWTEPLIEALARPAYRLAVYMSRDPTLAQDIVQEAFVRVLESPNTPRDPKAFRAYLYRVVLNLVRDHHRRQSRWAALRIFTAPPPDPADEVQHHHRDAALARAMRRLDRAQREAVYLRFFEDASYEEIGRMLSRREASVRVLVHRALAKLRESLGQDGLLSLGEEA